MEPRLGIAFKLYLPIVLSLVGLWALLSVRPGEGHTTMVLHPFGPLIDLPIPIGNRWIIYTVLGLTSPAFLLLYLVYDYTKFFPRRLRTEIFYDSEGIRKSLEVFSPEELGPFSIPADYPDYQSRYFQQLDTELKKMVGLQSFFGTKDCEVHSTGETTVVVEQTGGWQKYQVLEVEGQLTHTLEGPNIPRKKINTRFKKIASSTDHIQLGLADIFVRRTVLLRTHNAQYLIETSSSGEVPFKASLVGLTKVTILPWPEVRRSVYLAKLEGHHVPVAYAVYEYGVP